MLLRKRCEIHSHPLHIIGVNLKTCFRLQLFSLRLISVYMCSHSGCTTSCYYTKDYCYCSAGQYSSPYGYVLSTSSCSTCPGGQYQSNYGAASCNSCPAVSGSRVLDKSVLGFELTSLAHSCSIPCGFKGYYCPTGSTAYLACAAGYYCPSSSSSQTSCPAGYYCPAYVSVHSSIITHPQAHKVYLL